MAIIYSYPTATPKASDLLIGTVTYDGTSSAPVDGNPTRTFNIGDIANLLGGYTLSSQAAGVNANIVLTSSLGAITAVNLLRGTGISISDNGSNGITIGNTGVLSIVASNSTFVSSTPVLSATGNVTISSSLSAVGTPSSSNYLRGDNRWATPVTTITTQDSQYINLTPNSSSNGAVTITAQLSAAGAPSSSNFLRGDNVWAVPAGGGTITSVNAGTGIAVDNSNPSNPIISNTGVLSNIAGTGISISGASGNSTITNTAPDQVVSITGTGVAVVTGTYPDFNVDVAAGEQSVMAKDSFVSNGTETNYQLSVTPTSATYTEVFISGVYQEASTYTLSSDIIILSTPADNGDTIEIVTFNLGTAGGGGSGGGAVDSIIAGDGISVVNTDPANPIVSNTGVLSNIAGTGIFISNANGDSTITNTAPDQTVTITGEGGTTVSGSYPNFTVSSSASGAGLDSVVAGASIGVDNTDPANPIITNTAPDQTVVITGTGGTTITGSYPNFNIDSPSSGVSGITGSGTTSYLPLFSGATELSDSNVSFNGSVLSVASDANINGHTAGRGGNNISTNVVFGSGALPNNTTGDNNVAVGLTALANNSTGKYNVAVGTRALNANTTSFQNTAIGFNALYLQSTGGKNTAIGAQALLAATGDLNIGIGVNAGQSTTTARSSISIGGDSWDGFNATYNPAYNITTESNYISMGFGSTTNAYVNVAWTIVSDERDKTNFSDVPHGLEFVSKLKPISYQLKENRDSDKAVGDIKYGFKAQDILALEGDNPVIIDNKNEDKLRYNESNLIAVLVKSIQELEERIKTLETK